MEFNEDLQPDPIPAEPEIATRTDLPLRTDDASFSSSKVFCRTWDIWRS